MTSLADTIAQENQKPKGAPCTVGVLLTQLAATNRAAYKDLVAALADLSVKGTAIERGLKGFKTPVGAGSVARHRRGGCACQDNG